MSDEGNNKNGDDDFIDNEDSDDSNSKNLDKVDSDDNDLDQKSSKEDLDEDDKDKDSTSQDVYPISEQGEAVNANNISKDIKHIAIFLIILLLIFGSFFAYAKYKKSNEFTDPDAMHKANLEGKLPKELGYIYNGFSFIKIDETTWFTKIIVPNVKDGVINLQLRYGPRDLEDVKVSGDINYITQFDSAYIAFDPTSENLSGIAIGAADLTANLMKTLNITPVSACTKNETEACATKNIISCIKDPEYPIYFFRLADNPALIAKGNCLIIEGNGKDIVKAVDRLVLNWYGVMKNPSNISNSVLV